MQLRRGSLRFTQSRARRDWNCADKDAAMRVMYEQLHIRKPARFKAILMPGMFGCEAYYLRGRGVPAENMFAVEDNSIYKKLDTHQEIRFCRHPDRRELKGMRTTPGPMEAGDAVDYLYAEAPRGKWDLVYFDFMGQPHFDKTFKGCLHKLLARRMLSRDASVLLTFSRGRTRPDAVRLNNTITSTTTELLPTETYLKYLLYVTKYEPPFRLVSRCYISKISTQRIPIRFMTTLLTLGKGA